MFFLGFSGGQWRWDSEDLKNALLIFIDGLGRESPPQEYQGHVYQRDTRSVAHLVRRVKAIQLKHPSADGPFISSEKLDRIGP